MAKIILKITDWNMGVPYQPSEIRDDGSRNFGFAVLKGNTGAVAEIEEVKGSEALSDALVSINNEETGFFTIGCEKSFNIHEKGHWARGYIQFAINERHLIDNPQAYFKLFFDFNFYIREHYDDLQVKFCWELEKTLYLDIEQIGYSVAIWVETDFFESAVINKNVWEQGVTSITEYLCTLDFQNLYLGAVNQPVEVY